MTTIQRAQPTLPTFETPRVCVSKVPVAEAGGATGFSGASGFDPQAADYTQVLPRDAAGRLNAPAVSAPVRAVVAQEAFGQVGESPNATGRITNAAELAQFALAGYNGGDFGPVSIAPARLTENGTTRDVFLVGLSGTEPVPGQSTGWGTNLRVGLNRENDGLRNAREALMQLPEGSRLVLTGHSQGGMIAQQLAADPEIRRRFEVLHTVAFGSPPIAVGSREGQTRRLVAVGDPVALASPLGPLVALARRGTDTAQTAFLNPIDTHRYAYTDETRDLGQRDALGGRGTARLEFDPAERRFVSSPTR